MEADAAVGKGRSGLFLDSLTVLGGDFSPRAVVGSVIAFEGYPGITGLSQEL